VVSEKEDNIEKVSSAISFWLALIISIVAVFSYCKSTPQDDPATQKMRLFFRDNIIEVSEFIKLPYDEQNTFAENKAHPFFKSYMKASELEKEKLRALIHVSDDYSPNHYWLNVVFLWVIVFSSVWFVAKIVEGILVMVRDKESN
jgi:hypothetical protein